MALMGFRRNPTLLTWNPTLLTWNPTQYLLESNLICSNPTSLESIFAEIKFSQNQTLNPVLASD